MMKADVRDSANAAISANTTHLLKTAVRDTVRAGLPDTTAALRTEWRTTVKDSLALSVLKTAVRDSANAAITANTTHLLKTAVRDSANAAIAAEVTHLLLSATRDSANAAIAANTTHLLKTAVRDSADAAIAANTNVTNKLLLASADDSIKARYQSDFYLDFMTATADSNAANDSLQAEVTYTNPLGTKQALLAHNLAGVAEKLDLRWLFKLPNQYARLDSIVFDGIWTETIATENYGIAYVYQDSTALNRKELATTTSDTLRSAVARTTKSIMMAPNFVPGTGEVMLKLYIYAGAADTALIISRPHVYVTNR
jgi:hypothetical protein